MNSSILCSGNDLLEVLANIRSRGGFVERMEIGFGGKNAGYRVSYFERVVDNTRPTKVGVEAGEHAANMPVIQRNPEGRTRYAGENPAALIQFAGEAGSTPVGCETTKAAEVQPAQIVGAAVVIGMHTGKNVAGRTSMNSEVTGISERDRKMEETPPETVNPSISIESRLAALQERLKVSGKLRHGKSSTPPEHARLPYSD